MNTPRKFKSVPNRLIRWRDGRLPVVAVLLLGIVLTLSAAYWVRDAEKTKSSEEFARRTLARHQFLANSFDTYESALYSLRLVVENNYELEPAEFTRAASDIKSRAPGILALQWVPFVSPQNTPDFLGRVRDLVAPDFSIRVRQEDGTIEPVADPASPARRAVITYVYPSSGNEKTVGYDIFTAATAPDLRRAITTGQATLTRPLQLIQGHYGVIFAQLVERSATASGAPLSGPGLVQIVLEIDAVLNRLWNISTQNIIDFALYDITTEDPLPLYAELAGQDAPLKSIPALSEFAGTDTIRHELALGGRVWLACYRPSANWKDKNKHHLASAILLGGLLLTSAVAAFLDQIRRRTRAIEKQVELRTAELNDSRELLDRVIENSPNAIWVKDDQLRYFLVNGEFCRLNGKPRSLILGGTDAQFHDAATVAEIERSDRDILATGRALCHEGDYIIGGRRLTCLIGKFPLRHADGSIYAVGGIATDITALRQVENEKVVMERRLLEAQKQESLGVLAGGIAHDFNNLLTGILGHASLLSATLPPKSRAHASLSQIEASARRAAELCRHMLAYSGGGRFVLEAVDLSALTRDLLPVLELPLPKNISIRAELARDLPSVFADRAQLRQAISNLLANAVEAHGPEGGDIIFRTGSVAADAELFAGCIQSPALPPGPYVFFEITDAGSGIEHELLPRIFEPFFTTKFAGRGLGLASVLGVVRGHKGAIRVESTPDKGATFRFYLPVVSEPEPVSTHSTPSAPPRSSRRRLLIVDDEAHVREIASQLLEAIGYQCTSAADGEDALRVFRAAPYTFDAVLLDLTMPGLGGADVLRAIHALRPELPVLLMSGYSENDAAPLLATAHTGFLPKPFALDSLREKLEALLKPAGQGLSN